MLACWLIYAYYTIIYNRKQRKTDKKEIFLVILRIIHGCLVRIHVVEEACPALFVKNIVLISQILIIAKKAVKNLIAIKKTDVY
jgi:hypothetical protein